jgi:hypothetical protein
MCSVRATAARCSSAPDMAPRSLSPYGASPRKQGASPHLPNSRSPDAVKPRSEPQVPRLTTLLRALVADQAGAAAAPYHHLDVDALTVARGPVLEEKRRQANAAAAAASNGAPPGFAAGGAGSPAKGAAGTTAAAAAARGAGALTGAAAEGALLAELFGSWEKGESGRGGGGGEDPKLWRLSGRGRGLLGPGRRACRLDAVASGLPGTSRGS